ncbi:MAG: hydrogenase nickel incorporation protein HypB [Lapillicoccus sp.]
MGRFHRHDDGTTHTHDHGADGHDHDAASHDLGDHTAYETGPERVTVLERIFTENDRAADANRRAFDDAGVVCLNVMSSPGAGKTTVLAATLAHLRAQGLRVGVVEGDIETSLDADRLEGLAHQVSLLNTGNGFGGECHLDAPMVARALRALDLGDLDVVFVENVGNLVCPAEFDVGAHRRVMVCSVTEGEDKPLKYPVMFRSVEAVLVNKTDLLPYLDLDVDLLERNIHAVNPTAALLRMSARSGEGLDAWYAWLAGALRA